MNVRWVTTISMVLATVAAQAQQGRPPSDTGEGLLQEVVVTAQKREERLQDVPVAVTAFAAEQLKALDIKSVLDLGSLAPNL